MLGIAKIGRSNTFKRMYRRLPKRIKKDFDAFSKELLSEDTAPGRKIKKRRGATDLYEARLSSDHRVTFLIEGDVAVFQTIGSHDTAYGHL